MQDSIGQQANREPSAAGAAVTFIAAIVMIATGMILCMYGIAGLFSDMGKSTSVPFHIGPDGWSVIYLVGGVTIFLAGCNIFVGKFWARMVGITIATVTLIVSLTHLETYPVWSLGMIVLNLAILWALVVHGNDGVYTD